VSTQSMIGRSLEVVGTSGPKPPASLQMPTNSPFEVIDVTELARRLTLPASWIRSHTRARTTDEIPCIRFGKYVRFRWGSPELERWLKSHEEGTRG
jgi:hypothetical protein